MISPSAFSFSAFALKKAFPGFFVFSLLAFTALPAAAQSAFSSAGNPPDAGAENGQTNSAQTAGKIKNTSSPKTPSLKKNTTPPQPSLSAKKAGAQKANAEIKHGDPAAEAEIDKRFNSNPNTRGLRNILYAYIPQFLKQCPTWDVEMEDWHRCETVVPVPAVVKFRDKLRKEPLNTRIQQWFFLDAIGGIERPNDDMVRAKSFLAKYFAKIIRHELHDDNGWCYGPSWVGHSQKAWMPCAEIPPFASRTLPQWALYTPPAGHPRPTWPGTVDDTAPEPAGPMAVPETIIKKAAAPKILHGNLTKSYKGEDDALASLPALPANEPKDPASLARDAQKIAASPEGAALLQQILSGNPAERNQAIIKASSLLQTSPEEIAQMARRLKSSPQGMLILQQIQQLASASPQERAQNARQLAGMLGISPQNAQKAAQTLHQLQSGQSASGEHQTPEQLLAQAEKLVSDPAVLQQAQDALQNHKEAAQEIANSEAGQQALSQASTYIDTIRNGDSHPAQRDELDKADTGVFDIDKKNPNTPGANAGGARDLLSYENPDNENPGKAENDYGNSEDRNSPSAQSKSYAHGTGASWQNPSDPSAPQAGAETSPAQSTDTAESDNAVQMPSSPSPFTGESSPAPQNQGQSQSQPAGGQGYETYRETASSASENNAENTQGENSDSGANASSGTSSAWSNEAFGSDYTSSYSRPDFASPAGTAAQGENSPPAPSSEGAQNTSGQNASSAAPTARQQAAAQASAHASPKKTGKWKIIKQDQQEAPSENEWKVVKR